MKILYVGYKNPDFLAVTDYIEIALKDMGHEVLFMDHRRYRIPSRLRRRWPWLERWDAGRINRSIRRRLAQFRPDLFLVLGGYNLSPKTIRAARQCGAVSAAWFADYPLLFERYAQLAPHYDRFFASGTDALERHVAAGNARGRFLPFACVPDLHRPVAVAEDERRRYAADVVFIGSCYPERIRLLSLLAEFNLAIWGPGWEEKLPSRHPLRPFIRGGALKTEEWIRAVSAGRIALNYMGSGGSALDPNVVTMANSRVFELLGCGAFQLVDAKADVRRFFKSGREMALFEHPKEAPVIIRHYLKRKEEMEAIRHRARKSAMASHTYRHRLAELFRICGKA